KADDFNNMAVKFASFVESSDSSKALSSTEIFNSFYSVNASRISYMTIPRREEIRTFKMFMENAVADPRVYEFDMMTFLLNPNQLEIINSHPELYQRISIEPLFYE